MTTIAVINEEFLEQMFADMPDGTFAAVCGFAGDPGEATGAWRAIPWTFGDRLPRRIGPGNNTYVAISSFKAEPSGQFYRRKTHFARLAAVMVDDVGTRVEPQRIRLPVSAAIETSPRNFQAWYFVQPDAAADDREVAETLIGRMVASGLTADGTDPGMSGVTRYGRLPAGANGKRKYVAQLGRPFDCRLVKWQPERRYTIAAIAAAYELDMTIQKRRPRAPVAPADIELRSDAFALLLQTLADAGLYLESRAGGIHQIECPWADDHSDRVTTGTAVFDPGEANGWAGGFKCHHRHGATFNISHLYEWAAAYRGSEVEA